MFSPRLGLSELSWPRKTILIIASPHEISVEASSFLGRQRHPVYSVYCIYHSLHLRRGRFSFFASAEALGAD